MNNTLQIKKIIKFILILVTLFIYYVIDANISNPYTVFLMFIIGFIFAYKERESDINIIHKVIITILVIIMIMTIYPPLDVFGLFTHHMQSSAKILSVMIFLFGYYTSYLVTKK